MNPLYIQITICILTILTGLIAIAAPRSIKGFTGLIPDGGRGLTEIRSIMGGLFVALGLAPLILGAPAACTTLGIAYLGTGLVRLVSIFADKSAVRSNWISLAVELGFGLFLITQ